NAVRRAARARDESGIAVQRVHTMDQGVHLSTLGRRRQKDHPRAGAEVLLEILAARQRARAFEDEIDPQLPPRKLQRIAPLQRPHRAARDDQVLSLDLHRLRVPPVDRVEAKQIGEIRGIDQIIDRDQLERWVIDHQLQNGAADASEPVDSDSAHQTRRAFAVQTRLGGARCTRCTRCTSGLIGWTRDMYPALGEDPRDAAESLAGNLRNAVPPLGTRPARPVVERLSPWPERFPHDDPPDHPGGFVRLAVVVIHSRLGKHDLEVITRIHEIARVPGYSLLGDSERMMVVPRVVRGCRMHVLAHDPPYDRPGLHTEPDRIEPHSRAGRVATHFDYLDGGCRPAAARHKAEADERQTANLEELATRMHGHLASFAASVGDTYHTMMW